MKRLSTWLIVIGLLLFSVPFAGRAVLHYQQDRLYQKYEKEHVEKGQDGPDPTIMEEGFRDEVASDSALSMKSGPENVIGTIEIPSIDSSQLLLEGSSAAELRYGAGHVTGTAMPGEAGNCAVAGHRNYTFGSYFSRLDEVKPGDKIRVEFEGTAYTYVMEDSITVLPTDTSVLDQDESQKRITLITCTPKGSNTHRLIVRGRLSE